MSVHVAIVVLYAGERGVHQVPGRVLSGDLYQTLSLLRRRQRQPGGARLVDVPLLHVQTGRAPLLRDLHHRHDTRQQSRAGKSSCFIQRLFNR